MGNFKAPIKLVSPTDEDLKKHSESCPKTATYISKTTQNDLSGQRPIADFVKGKIVEEVRASSWLILLLLLTKLQTAVTAEQLGTLHEGQCARRKALGRWSTKM